MYKTSVLRIDTCKCIVISSPSVIKLWEFSFPKLKNKNCPPFLDFENLRFPLKKYPFLAKWVQAWMYALVRTGGTGQAWGVPSGVLPPNLSPTWAVCIEMHGNCSTNDGTAVGQPRWEFKPLASPTKVDFNSISRFCANADLMGN